jgi:hypothetical protein
LYFERLTDPALPTKSQLRTQQNIIANTGIDLSLRFVSLCIIVQFKQITNQMQQFSSLLFWCLFTAQHVSGVSPPIIRSSITALAVSDFTFVSWWESCCFRGQAVRQAGPTTNTARLSPRYESKTRGCHCSYWAPDDGRGNARNMLSCK